MDDPELAALRQKRLQEMQAQLGVQQNEQHETLTHIGSTANARQREEEVLLHTPHTETDIGKWMKHDRVC